LFKILGFDRDKNTMMVDWLDGRRFSHAIPHKIIDNPRMSAAEVTAEIERLRPPEPEPEPESGHVDLGALEKMVEPEPEPEPEPTEPQQSDGAVAVLLRKKFLTAATYIVDAGDFIKTETMNAELGRTSAFTYVVKGTVTLHNENRDPISYSASDSLVANGNGYPGKYTIVADTDSIFRCIAFHSDLSNYDVQQLVLSPGDPPVTIDQNWEYGVTVRGYIQINGNRIVENTVFEPKQGDQITVSASSLVLLTRRREV